MWYPAAPIRKSHDQACCIRLARKIYRFSLLNHYEDFYQAASCMLVVGPHFEKYLVFALMLYVSLAYVPDQEGRKRLSCSHTVFRTPRMCLTRDLHTLKLASSDLVGSADFNPSEVYIALRDCHIWIWLVLICSWTATDGTHSEQAKRLRRLFRREWGRHARDWRFLDSILKKFFSTSAMSLDLEHYWRSM
jgi:hypothetical protein